MLFDRYQFVDLALKVVGVGSVGTRCFIALMLADPDDPLFLQIKEARPSVLEPYVPKVPGARKGKDQHNGHRVVLGQRLMQAASDIFLGWATGSGGDRDFYVRQLRDMKIAPAGRNADANDDADPMPSCAAWGWRARMTRRAMPPRSPAILARATPLTRRSATMPKAMPIRSNAIMPHSCRRSVPASWSVTPCRGRWNRFCAEAVDISAPTVLGVAFRSCPAAVKRRAKG